MGRVGPDRARRIGLVEQALAQTRPFAGGGVGGVPAPDQPVLAINRVAEGPRFGKPGHSPRAAPQAAPRPLACGFAGAALACGLVADFAAAGGIAFLPAFLTAFLGDAALRAGLAGRPSRSAINSTA